MTKLIPILIIISLPMLMVDVCHVYISTLTSVGLDIYATIIGSFPIVVFIFAILIFKLKTLKIWIKVILIYGLSLLFFFISSQMFIKEVDSLELNNEDFPSFEIMDKIDKKLQIKTSWSISSGSNCTIQFQKGLVDRQKVIKILEENGIELKR